MSTQAVADFILKANDDPEFDAEFEGKTADERIASVVAAGHEQGFEFTAVECREFLETARELGTEELTEEQLEHVAGGGLVRNFFRTASGAVAPLQNAIFNAIAAAAGDDGEDGDSDASSDSVDFEKLKG